MTFFDQRGGGDRFGWNNSFGNQFGQGVPPTPLPPPKPKLFEGFRPGLFVLGALGLAFVVVAAFLAAVGINFLSELGSREIFRVVDWFRGAGFRSRFELANFFRLLLLAAFIGWAANRFRK